MPANPSTKIAFDKLFEIAHDLVEEPEANPQYTRGICELLADAYRVSAEQMYEHLWPREGFEKYAYDVIGDKPTDAADWQRVAEEAFNDLVEARSQQAV